MSTTTLTKINTHQAAAVFGVTPMTLANWRKGSPQRTKLPTTTPPNGSNPNSVWYKVSDLKAWSKKNGIAMGDVTHLEHVTPAKPGPKPRKVAAAVPDKAPSKNKKSASTAG